MLGEKKKRALPKHFNNGNVDELLGQRKSDKGLKSNGSKFTKREPFFRREDSILPVKKPLSTNATTGDSNDNSTEHIQISASQKEVLEAIMQRKSVFFTGSAGTGKSYILRILQDVLSILNLSDKVAITAPTGVAACNISGLTIHSWSGLGLGKEPIDQLVNRISKVAKKRWIDTDILIIDEISMLSGDMFDKLSKIGSRMRNDSRPFGGIQLILCGDFFQLPPVGKSQYCFDSQAWKLLFDTKIKNNMFVLDKVFRQKNDLTFLEILNELREGIVSDRAIYAFNRTKQSNSYARATDASNSLEPHGNNDDIRPTKLFSTNAEVDTYNTAELNKLPNSYGQFFTYTATDNGNEPYLTQMKAGTKAPQRLELRIDSQVMLLKNLDTSRGLVNGARGVVVGFEASNHRSKYYNLLPIVKFECTVGSSKTVEEIVLIEESWEVKSGESVVASREQIPLMLAWAISIHKSQGMTIPKLEVNLGQIFEYGQGYVALSRATCLSGLIVHNFERSRIKAHDSVKNFYKSLTAATDRREVSASSNGGELVVTSLAELSAMYSSPAPHVVDRDTWLEKRQPATAEKENSAQNLCDMDEWLDGPFSIASKRNLQSSSKGPDPINVISPPGSFPPEQERADLVDSSSRTEVGPVSSGGPFNASYYNAIYGGVKANSSNNNNSINNAQKNPFSTSSSNFKTPFPVHSNMAGPFSSFSESKRLSGGRNIFGSSSTGNNATDSGSSSRNLFVSSSNSSGIPKSDHTSSSAFKSAGTVHPHGPFSSHEHATTYDGMPRVSGQHSQPTQLAGADSFSIFRCRDSSPYSEGPFSSSTVTPYEKQSSNCIDLSGDDIRLTPNNNEISIEMQRKIEASRRAALEKLKLSRSKLYGTDTTNSHHN